LRSAPQVGDRIRRRASQHTDAKLHSSEVTKCFRGCPKSMSGSSNARANKESRMIQSEGQQKDNRGRNLMAIAAAPEPGAFPARTPLSLHPVAVPPLAAGAGGARS